MSGIADIIARAACVHQRPTPAAGQGDAYDVLSSWAKAGDVSADAELYGFDMTAQAILSALTDAGFVVVPKEPTEEMCGAGLDPAIDGIAPMYRAMIDARPK